MGYFQVIHVSEMLTKQRREARDIGLGRIDHLQQWDCMLELQLTVLLIRF